MQILKTNEFIDRNNLRAGHQGNLEAQTPCILDINCGIFHKYVANVLLYSYKNVSKNEFAICVPSVF